jgi:hypothetical protein
LAGEFSPFSSWEETTGLTPWAADSKPARRRRQPCAAGERVSGWHVHSAWRR